MASKPINFRWIRTSSQKYLKIMYSIEDNFSKICKENDKIILVLLDQSSAP